MPSRSVSSTVISALLFILLCACGPAQTPLPPTDTFQVLATRSQAIGPEGGTIAGEGWRVVVPGGALTDTVDMTVSQLDAAQYLDSIHQGMFLRVTSPVTQLARPAQIRVALPEWYTPEDAGAAMSLYVDEPTGEMLYEPVAVEVNNGQPELVLETDHFSNRLIEWIEEKFQYRFPPEQAEPLEVPFYSQSGTPYCWAAMSQMVAEGARHSSDGEVYGLIGVMSIDPTASWWQIWKSPSQARLRASPALGAELTRRTGKAPERIMWITFQQQIQVEYIQRELAFNGHAVGLFTHKQEHAFVLVGYPDRKSFYTLDPRDPATMYQVRTLADLGLDGTGNTTVVIPLPLAADRPLVSINLGDHFLDFTEPAGATYAWRWDFRAPTGYVLTGSRPADNPPIVNSIPGEVTQLVIRGPADFAGIEIANAHLGMPVNAQVQVEIQGQAPNSPHYVQTAAVTVPAKTMVRAVLQPIPVDEFRAPSLQPVSYTFKATVSVDGKITDDASFDFVLDPLPEPTPEPAKPAVNKCICPDGQPLGLDLDLGCEDLLMPRMNPDWDACYRGCLEQCGCDPNDLDLTCACECVMGQ